MLSDNLSKVDFISSVFTRNKGFTHIECSTKLSRKDAVSILNAFTPQGASPQGSVRIANFRNYLGVGYYCMEDSSTARISTFFEKKKILNLHHLSLLSSMN